MSANNGARKNISKCTRRIAFFGTPHEGSEAAKWVERGQAFFDYIGRDYPDHMEKKSEILSRLGEKFQNLLKSRANKPDKIDIMCFFEGKDFTYDREGYPPCKVC